MRVFADLFSLSFCGLENVLMCLLVAQARAPTEAEEPLRAFPAPSMEEVTEAINSIYYILVVVLIGLLLFLYLYCKFYVGSFLSKPYRPTIVKRGKNFKPMPRKSDGRYKKSRYNIEDDLDF
jgi:hypothetical protein